MRREASFGRILYGGLFALMEEKSPTTESSKTCPDCFTDSTVPSTMILGNRWRLSV